MSAIIELAQRLGKAIADSPQVVSLQAAQKEMKKKPEIGQLLKDFQGHSDKIAKLQEENKPIEVDDKQRLQELHNKLIACEEFKKLTAAQVEYIDLMRKVNEAIQKRIEGTEPAE